MNINRSFTKKSRNQMLVDLLDDLVFINYNMKLAEYFETNKLLIEQDAQKYDPIRIVDLMSLSMTKRQGLDQLKLRRRLVQLSIQDYLLGVLRLYHSPIKRLPHKMTYHIGVIEDIMQPILCYLLILLLCTWHCFNLYIYTATALISVFKAISCNRKLLKCPWYSVHCINSVDAQVFSKLHIHAFKTLMGMSVERRRV